MQLQAGDFHTCPWTFTVANVEMAILSCGFHAFHGLQVDFTDMLLVELD